MEIFALKGYKVKVKTDKNGNLINGYDGDKNIISKHLKIGEVYQIEETIVHNSHTDIYLQGFGNICFNSVCFEGVTLQATELNQAHADYNRYHLNEKIST